MSTPSSGAGVRIGKGLTSLLVTLVLLSGSVRLQGQDLEALFPPSEEIPGWVHDGERYVATDESSLAEWINGAAPYYIEFGAVEVGFQDYLKEDVLLSVEIYRMETPERAAALMADIYVENPESVETGDEGRLLTDLPGVLLLELRRGAWFVRLAVDDKSEPSREALLGFASRIADSIQKKNDE